MLQTLPHRPADEQNVSSLLLLDVGQYRIKWRYGKRENVLTHQHQWLDCCQAIAADLKPTNLKCVLLSLAPDHPFLPALSSAIEQVFAVRPRPLRTQSVHDNDLKLQPAYDRLGSDRWCAMLAARRRFGSENVVLIDGGSALTADLIAAHGLHLGGWIIPGLGRMTQDCATLTGSDLSLPLSVPTTVEPGQDTIGCIDRGVGRLVCAFVEKIWDNARRMSSEDWGHSSVRGEGDRRDPRLIVTGGDGEWLAQALAHLPCQFIPDLVMEGMLEAHLRLT